MISFEECVAGGGVALFPTDTVYGLGARADSAEAVARIYAMKGRPPDRPSALMFFDLEAAIAEQAGLGPRTEAALRRLLPGPVTAVLPSGVGIRVPELTGALRPLRGVRVPVIQTSANLSGQPDARRIEDVPPSIRDSVDLVIDGGELPGIPSTVVDLSAYEADGAWRVLREGAVPAADLGL